MIKTVTQAHGNAVDYRPEVPVKVAPKIRKEYHEDGERFYKTECGKTYVADIYDRHFKVAKTKVLAKHSKGKNPDRTKEWMKD